MKTDIKDLIRITSMLLIILFQIVIFVGITFMNVKINVLQDIYFYLLTVCILVWRRNGIMNFKAFFRLQRIKKLKKVS